MDNQLQQNSPQKSSKPSLIIILAVILFGSIASFYGFLYLKNIVKKNQPQQALEENGQDLFELQEDAKNESERNGINLDELKAQAINEKGSEFVYQTIIKNQNQIEELRGEIQALKGDISKLRNQEKFTKILVNYINFRDKFFAKKNFKTELQSLSLLTSQNEFLSKNLQQMQDLSKSFLSKPEIEAEFALLIPRLIATKNSKNQENQVSSLSSKIRYQLSRLVIVRKINSKNPQELDYLISLIESNLKEQDYQAALNNIASLDHRYFSVLSDFIERLNFVIEAKKTDEEILNHLKNLS